jgi:hypothetical protein
VSRFSEEQGGYWPPTDAGQSPKGEPNYGRFQASC